MSKPMTKSQERREAIVADAAKGFGFNPLSARIIAKPIELETKTASGFLLPQAVAGHEAPALADVVAVGPEVTQVEVGDRVLYIKYAPEEFKKDGADYLIFEEEDCLATVTE